MTVKELQERTIRFWEKRNSIYYGYSAKYSGTQPYGMRRNNEYMLLCEIWKEDVAKIRRGYKDTPWRLAMHFGKHKGRVYCDRTLGDAKYAAETQFISELKITEAEYHRLLQQANP